MAGDDKTEAATPKKRNEVRRRGQVAKSQDLSSTIVFLAVITCIHSMGGASVERIRGYMRASLGATHPLDMTPQMVILRGGEMMLLLAQTVGPLIATAMLTGITVNAVQTNFLFSFTAMKPDFNRLNPLNGIKNYFSARGLVETTKAILKLSIVAYIANRTINDGYMALLATIRDDMTVTVGVVTEMVYRLAQRIGMFLFILAATDYGWQRYSHEKSIRMTKEEVKQEAKQADANPQVKGQLRRRQREIARRRMMEDVPKADVVITNPTHFAVALKYEADRMGAPEVVAKGADLVAQKIREIAIEHGIPIVENPPLARALFKQVEVGHPISADLYAAVAEVLAYVYQINARRTSRGAYGQQPI